jgi:hypothetical protein
VSRKRSLTCLGALVATSLLLAACGDDDDDVVADDAGAVVEDDAAGAADGEAVAEDAIDDAMTDDGGYEYASDVSAHRLVVEDICDINELLDADEIDFDAVAARYEDGEHSVNSDGSVRTLAGFSTATDKLHGLGDHYESETPLDDFVSAAIDGSGEFEGEADLVRRQGIQKGIQNQIMIAWVVHELNAALAKADDGAFDADEGAPTTGTRPGPSTTVPRPTARPTPPPTSAAPISGPSAPTVRRRPPTKRSSPP